MNTHADTQPQVSRCCLSVKDFDIRLPAADAAAAANANAAQSLKQQWKTATHMTQRQKKPHTAEELPSR